MTNQRRKRVDGEKGLQQIVSDAALAPDFPPDGISLTDDQMTWWNILYCAKARRAWLKQDLAALADACRVRSQIEDIRAKLSSIDPLIDLTEYEKLTKLVDLCVKQYRLLCVYLQIHPEATQGKAMKQVEQNKIHAGAVGSNDMDDDLIPRPTH